MLGGIHRPAVLEAHHRRVLVTVGHGARHPACGPEHVLHLLTGGRRQRLAAVTEDDVGACRVVEQLQGEGVGMIAPILDDRLDPLARRLDEVGHQSDRADIGEVRGQARRPVEAERRTADLLGSQIHQHAEARPGNQSVRLAEHIP